MEAKICRFLTFLTRWRWLLNQGNLYLSTCKNTSNTDWILLILYQNIDEKLLPKGVLRNNETGQFVKLAFAVLSFSYWQISLVMLCNLLLKIILFARVNFQKLCFLSFFMHSVLWFVFYGIWTYVMLFNHYELIWYKDSCLFKLFLQVRRVLRIAMQLRLHIKS